MGQFTKRYALIAAELCANQGVLEAKGSLIRLGFAEGVAFMPDQVRLERFSSWAQVLHDFFDQEGFSKASIEHQWVDEDKEGRRGMRAWVRFEASVESLTPLLAWFFAGWCSGYSKAHLERDLFFRVVSVPGPSESLCLLEGREEFAWPEAETEPMADYFRYRKSPGETRSLAMRVCLDRLRDIAMSGAGVYLQADHLDDPEYFARYVHHHSERAEKRFVFLEARGLSRNLFESAIASAGNGTLYLQSIEAFPQLLQKRLVKVSGFANQGIDLRLICSGEKSLASFLRDGSIVPDLARRMQGSEVFVPPIRMRMEDLIPLSRRILLKYSPDGLSDALQFSPQVLTEFLHYGWPGGLRELRATIHTMLVRRQEHELRLDIKHLPQNFRDREIHPESTHFSGLTIEEAERRLILSTLQKMRGNKKECAKALNIGYNTLWRKLKSYQSKGRGRRSPSTPIA